jgi:glutamine synthetase
MNLGEFQMSVLNKFSSDIKFLRIVWCDNANIIRSKSLRLNSKSNSMFCVGISKAQQAVPVTYDGVVPDSILGPVGEVYLKADNSTITQLPYAPCHLRCMGDMYFNDEPWEYCTRGYLKRMIDRAGEYGLNIKASFENEFYLLKNSENLESVDNTPFASSLSMDVNYDVIMDIVDSIEAQGMVVEQYYPEAGPGQQEITIGYDDVLKVADNQIMFRETVHAVALKHGLKASFLPKIFPDSSGSGCHLHMSMWKNGENITHDSSGKWKLSKEAGYFIAGVLQHLPSLMAITTPISNSYRRIKPHSWSGKYKCWGLDNREASIRVVTEPDGSIKHFELKTSDAAANPYLALGAVIMAGIDGLDNKFKLPYPVQFDPGDTGDGEHDNLDIEELPSCPADALENLENNIIIMNSLGKGLSTAYLAVKREEWRILKNLNMDEEVSYLIDKY